MDAECLSELKQQSRDAYGLARYLSLAVVVEQELLRRVRLDLLPHTTAAVEADLWFSEIVESRSASGIVFHTEAGRLLRDELARDQEAITASWEILDPLHREISPAMRLEEELRYWSHRDGTGEPSAEARRKVDELLNSANLALAGAEREGLAPWALRALSRLPLWVRQSEAGRMLATAAALRVSEKIDPELLMEASPEWMPWVVPGDYPRVTVGVRFDGTTLELGDPNQPGALLLELPRTAPLQVQIGWGETSLPPTLFHLGETITEQVGSSEVRLETLTGEVYELRPDLLATGTESRIVTFESLRERHQPYFGFSDLVESLVQGEASYAVVCGRPGSGKTALLCRVLGRAEEVAESAGVGVVPHHFIGDEPDVRPSLPRALQNLALQLEQRFPAYASPGQRPRQRLQNLLSQVSRSVLVPESKRLLLVLGGVQHAEDAGEGANPLAEYLSERLPDGVRLIWETDNSSELFEYVANRPDWDTIHLDEPMWLKERQTSFMEMLAGEVYQRGAVEVAARESLGDLYYARLLREAEGSEIFVVESPHAVLEGFLELLIERLRFRESFDKNELALAHFSTLQEPITESMLDYLMTGKVPKSLEDPARFDWRRLNPLVHWTPGGARLQIHHRRLRQPLLEFLSHDAQRGALEAQRHLLARWPPPTELGDFGREYVSRHVLKQLVDLEDKDRTEKLAFDLDFLRAVLAQNGPARFMELMNRTKELLGPDRFGALHKALQTFLSQDRPRPEDLPSMVPNLRKLQAAVGKEVPMAAPALRLTEVALASSTVERTEAGHSGAVTGCRFIEGGRQLLSWSEDATVRVWDVETRRLEFVLRGHHDAVTDCAAHGEWLFTASLDDTVRVWNLPYRELTDTLSGHRAGAVGLRVWRVESDESSKPTHCLSASRDGTARLWDVREGRELFVLEGHQGEVTAAVFDPQRETIYSAGRDGAIGVGRVRGGEVEFRSGAHRGPIRGLELLPDGDLLSWSADRGITLWSPDGSPIRTFSGHELGVSSLAILSEQPLRFVSAGEDRRVCLWERDRTEPVEVFRDHSGAVLSVALQRRSGLVRGDRLQDGFVVVFGSSDRTIGVRLIDADDEARRLEGHRSPVRALALWGDLLVSGSEDGQLLTWELSQERPRPRILGTWAQTVTGLSFSSEVRRGEDEGKRSQNA